MSHVSAQIRREVVARANDRCEYCGLTQADQEATFHVDHVVPKIAGGPTDMVNLALACVSCSLRKGARKTAIDPLTSRPSPLFNPREMAWRDHFRWEGVLVAGLTPIGRCMVEALRLNRPSILAIRREQAAR